MERHAVQRASSGDNAPGQLFDIRTVSQPQAADLIGCSVRTIQRLCKEGELEPSWFRKRGGKGKRIFTSSVERFILKRRGA